MNCIECGTSNIHKNGTIESSIGLKQKYKCKDCNKNFSVLIESEEEIEYNEEDTFADDPIYVRESDWLAKNIYNKNVVVITAAQNNTPINKEFFSALKSYVSKRNAGFAIIPIKYKTINSEDSVIADLYDVNVEPFIVENTLTWDKHNVKVYAGLKIQATAENPLSGLDPLSKGHSIIIGHAQVQLRMLPNLQKRIADVLTSTGVVTQKNYSKTKMGEKARFNHSLSAIVLEFDKTSYHLRHLNYDTKTESFCDLDQQYFADGKVLTCQAEALVTGDEHIAFRDPLVELATYRNSDSMVSVLKPKAIVRHDVLDAHSISHHTRKNVFSNFAKYKSGQNRIAEELDQAIEYLNETTPSWSKSLIVQSNHNEHLLRWLNDIEIKTEPWNAIVYHYLMYKMLLQTEMGNHGTEHPDPFELYARDALNDNIVFVNRQGAEIQGIEVGAHGDYGVNGARGSAKSFARMPNKTITGHSHSPAIEKGAYVVGTSSRLVLEYNKGASSWHHAHCIIHTNGKRQLVFITPDGWRL